MIVLLDMTESQRKRDPRYTRTIGEKPDLGRRYVENGKVKIEWFEEGKRRSRTIGDNDAKTRREADEELERLLGLADADSEPEAEERVDEDFDDHFDDDDECHHPDWWWFVEEARGHAETLLDFADDLAERFEKGLVQFLEMFRKSEDDDDDDEDDVEDAEVVEEIVDDDVADESESDAPDESEDVEEPKGK